MRTERENVRVKDALRAAKMYYESAETMEAIASELKVSRSSVSRLLSFAREQGLVEIRINEPRERHRLLEERFLKKFGVNVHIVETPYRITEIERLEMVAKAAAPAVAAAVTPSQTVAVAWGATLSAITRFLPPKDVYDVHIVQMNGAANVRTSGMSYTGGLLGRFAQRFGATMHQFPVPALFDDPVTKKAMWQERSIKRVLDLQRRAGLFVFGLGSPHSGVPSHLFADEYLDLADLQVIAEQQIVGDCATTFYRIDGTNDNIPLNLRSSGPSFEQIIAIPHRLCVVAGQAKKETLLGALRAGLITELVVDEQCAKAVLDAVSISVKTKMG